MREQVDRVHSKSEIRVPGAVALAHHRRSRNVVAAPSPRLSSEKQMQCQCETSDDELVLPRARQL